MYEFAWQSPMHGLGAAHAIEIPFVFDALSLPENQLVIGAAAPVELAAQMHATWIRFATTGDPGWQPFDATYPVMIFGAAGGSAVALDPRADERLSWRT